MALCQIQLCTAFLTLLSSPQQLCTACLTLLYSPQLHCHYWSHLWSDRIGSQNPLGIFTSCTLLLKCSSCGDSHWHTGLVELRFISSEKTTKEQRKCLCCLISCSCVMSHVWELLQSIVWLQGLSWTSTSKYTKPSDHLLCPVAQLSVMLGASVIPWTLRGLNKEDWETSSIKVKSHIGTVLGWTASVLQLQRQI